MTRVAIIDIGSNSIKLLVASRLAGHAVNVIATESIDARISAGISRDQPTLAEAGMERGLTGDLSLRDVCLNYKHAIEGGLLKIIAKMGIAVISSYRGGYNFEALGLSRALVSANVAGP